MLDCASCGQPFKALRPHAKFCSDTCRKRGSRGVLAVVEPAEAKPESAPSSLVTATRTVLEDAGRGDAPLSLLTLELAQAMEDTLPGSPAKATIAKQFQATYAEAMKGVRGADTPMDELRARRDALRRSS